MVTIGVGRYRTGGEKLQRGKGESEELVGRPGFGGAWLLGGALKLRRDDRIAFLFSGAQKSIALGAPLASVLFPPAHSARHDISRPLRKPFCVSFTPSGEMVTMYA